MVTELNDETVRETSLYSNRILYKIKASHIDVLAVIHKRRDLQPEEIPRDQLIKATTTTAWMQDAGGRATQVQLPKKTQHISVPGLENAIYFKKNCLKFKLYTGPSFIVVCGTTGFNDNFGGLNKLY